MHNSALMQFNYNAFFIMFRPLMWPFSERYKQESN